MAGTLALTEKQIKQAVEKVKQIRPAYTDILEFYGQLFIAQEASKAAIEIDPIIISEKALAQKREAGFPLIQISAFVIDKAAAQILFKQICRIAAGMTGKIGDTAKTILETIKNEQLNLPHLFQDFLNENDADLGRLADGLTIDGEILALFTYAAINPSIVLNTDQLSTFLDTDATWEKGYCPICGSLPDFAMLEHEGKRSFFCGFCRHQWYATRRFCPFCENREEKTLAYFFSEAEKEYRVDLCEKCHKYIKTLDMRNTERIIYVPLERVATLHLDMMAKEKGFESGVAICI
jgi:FdhE protein